ncbi:MAG TPA: hypothetical protein VD768_03370 [Sphingomicrobium sp.]|nr:hypothetical protein [Sphingomicrobium sp.]
MALRTFVNKAKRVLAGWARAMLGARHLSRRPSPRLTLERA